jgi:CO/xanthine dehydrogenase FAD-binding subunit
MSLDHDVKIVAGAISPVPVRVEKAERLLGGEKLLKNDAKILGQSLSELILKITPEAFDRDYKAQAAYGLAEDLIDLFKGRKRA